MKKNKTKKWVKKRHGFIFWLLRPVVKLYSKIIFGVKIQKFCGDKKRNYFIFYNHQTSADQFFVANILKKPIYFVATEDIFSTKYLSKFLRFWFAPIPINKTDMDLSSIKTCIKVAKEGGNICIAPEGNRTFNGATGYIKPAIVKLVRVLKLPLMIIRIEGGYGVQPRWTDKARKGEMSAKVYKVIEFEEYSKYSDQELFEIIKEGLYVNDFVNQNLYKSQKKAECLERLIYTCPYCGFTEWESSGNSFKCKKCLTTVEYCEDKTLKCKKNDFPFKNIYEWSVYQNNYVITADYSKYNNSPIFTDNAKLFNVILKKGKKLISQNSKIFLFEDKITISYEDKTLTLPFNEIEGVAVLGRNKLNVKYNGKIYQLKGNKSFNAVKYINFYYRYNRGEKDGIFLGL